MDEYQCRIVRVVDGDTVEVGLDLGVKHWIHDARIRLFGVDCSRVPQPRRRRESCRTLAAKEFVEGSLHDRRDLHSHHQREG
jgi:endonuclease YncB( thermonuclease family)